MPEFFDPTPEEQKVVLVDAPTIRKAERLIVDCEACTEEADIPFDNVLDRITGQDPAVTNYNLGEPAKCPRCKRPVGEKTDRVRRVKSLFIWAAVVVFLFFVGTSLYLNLRPKYWSADCVAKDNPDRVAHSGSSTEQVAKEFAATFERIGLTCTVSPVRRLEY